MSWASFTSFLVCFLALQYFAAAQDQCVAGNANAVTCDANAACSDGDDSAGAVGTAADLCTCNAGYSGDGTSCTDVNECTATTNPQDDCVAEATCVNTAGSFTCSCPDGHTGNGKMGNAAGDGCTDINECTATSDPQDNCHANATCINIDGSFACHCQTGLIGDGILTSVDTALGCYAPTTTVISGAPGVKAVISSVFLTTSLAVLVL